MAQPDLKIIVTKRIGLPLNDNERSRKRLLVVTVKTLMEERCSRMDELAAGADAH